MHKAFGYMNKAGYRYLPIFSGAERARGCAHVQDKAEAQDGHHTDEVAKLR